MRVMQIDDFLELTEGSGSDARSYDWARLVKEGRAARKAADGGSWRIGDLAALVEHRYASGALKRFADEIGESLGSVRRFRWVAGAYDETMRQRFSLSFSHFQAVASLDDRTTWNASPPAPHVAYKASVEAVAKKVSSLNEADDRLLAKAVRAGLADAVEELATQVERLTARLHKAQRRSMSIAR